MTANTVATLLEAACEVQEEELSARCMALIEEQTEAVLVSDAFVHSLSEDTLCRVLRSGHAGGAGEGRGTRLRRGRGGGVHMPLTQHAHTVRTVSWPWDAPVLRC